MNKYVITIAIVALFLFGLFVYARTNNTQKELSDIAINEDRNFQIINPEVFDEMLARKDFVLIDVHIPEQVHIEGTDAVIPYNSILENSLLPKDKNAKIVLYCRSGSMSVVAARSLVDAGYTNIYDLAGGKNAYNEFVKDK
ncbi:MAG: rhodanese-like domain-containing protein [Candidatus Magasanikbacteria bacterium]|uniref:Sulfurtransferase n=1 Tax=Candidatus Magasanikbacteria bacterium CG10_big_fil_rev_8_21_14_0_10_38_6 TaxID=1974647 RepID=A0A2M6P091_9BACT|nr:rhodanese-like domain-containing protein [Candidatus Magasanikbacteria bacterium]NCS71957.1 rhodanese-like domain-containing protein [Candidatus Magasanikbacteria bacterium]PIR77117.1 MAG: sulfurtransferase [Candidatus Magasanikbacteria bacterium CG10_big_fil_rev_8_21_14_0_10_38_6]